MGKSVITKKHIFDSYRLHMLKSSFQDVSVQQIVDDCGISRRTFYYHFADYVDLVKWGFRFELANALESACPPEILFTPDARLNDKYPDLPYYARKTTGVRSLDGSQFFAVFHCYLDGNRFFYKTVLESSAATGFMRYLERIYTPVFFTDIHFIAGGRSIPSPVAENMARAFFDSTIACNFYRPCFSNRSVAADIPKELGNVYHECLYTAVNQYFAAANKPFKPFSTSLRSQAQ